jgi:hypothetical protein
MHHKHANVDIIIINYDYYDIRILIWCHSRPAFAKRATHTMRMEKNAMHDTTYDTVYIE